MTPFFGANYTFFKMEDAFIHCATFSKKQEVYTWKNDSSIPIIICFYTVFRYVFNCALVWRLAQLCRDVTC